MQPEKRKKILHVIFFVAASVILIIGVFFACINFPVKDVETPVPLGVTFSARYAQDIETDWRQSYVAMLDDLKVRDIRIPVYWDLVEKEQEKYDFSDIDWQMDQAAAHGARVVLVIGQKVPRWPECFIPEWAKNDDAVRKESLLFFEQMVVERYRNHGALSRWQVENEPFLDFGVCPKFDVNLLDGELAAVRASDSAHPVMLTDSGELSVWVHAAKRADIFGTTMYRTVYSAKHGFIRYPIGPNFFKFKKWISEIFAGQSNVVVIELQGEPWIDGWTVSQPLEKQLGSMNADILRSNVQFAKNTGLSEIYIWGVEWWYWLREKQNNSTVWDEAKKLFEENRLQ